MVKRKHWKGCKMKTVYIKVKVFFKNREGFQIKKLTINNNGTSFKYNQKVSSNPNVQLWSNPVFLNVIETDKILKNSNKILSTDSLIVRTI